MNFEFQNKGGALSECTGTAKRMKLYGHDTWKNYLREKYVVSKFDEVKINEIADLLCSDKNLNVYLISKKVEGDTTSKAPWYDTKFSKAPFDDETTKRINNPACVIKSKKLDLPPANTMIPKNFDIIAKDESLSAKPHLLKQWENTELWYKKDDTFNRPKS